MSTPDTTAPAQPAPFPWLVRSRNVTMLWIVRMLVRLDAFDGLWERQATAVFRHLHVPCVTTHDDLPREELFRRLEVTLEHMERHAARFRMGRVLEKNLALIGKTLAFTSTERLVLALAVLFAADEVLNRVAANANHQRDVPDQLATIIGTSAIALDSALSRTSRLGKSKLVKITGGGSPASNVVLTFGTYRKLASTRMRSVDDLIGAFLRTSRPASLSPADYAHLAPDFGFVARVLGDALDNRRPGVNVLLHGPPGTGKTELTRTLAHTLTAPLFEVSSVDEDGKLDHPRARLIRAATAQSLLGRRRALLVFDEIDAIFNDGSELFGTPTTAESAKAWVNDLLEDNPVPTIWIANRIMKMDPAFVRRFDLVIALDTPPMSQRLKQLERLCGDFLEPVHLRRLAYLEAATPAVVARAAGVVRRANGGGPARGKLLEAVLDGTLQAQGHPTVRQACRGAHVGDYDPGLCHASEDLDRLADGLARAQAGRICLYGPPGTGKTAFGHWLARRLDKPLQLKRMSDLQSPWVGVMEQNLARAFEQAARANAILQIDEVDSFLRDRQTAQRGWEVSQVNEFLTQLECFEGIFIASTNLMDGLDQAALRRFDHKIKMDYMRPEQAWRMFLDCIGKWGIVDAPVARLQARLAGMAALTPGDFAVIARKHALRAFPTAAAVAEALDAEVALKHGTPRRIGFV